MHAIRGPAGYQTFRVGNSRLSVLHDVALDVAPLAVAVGGVTLRAEVDGEDSVLTEDVSAESGQTRDARVVARLGDEVALEEMNARGGEFNHFGQVDADELIHAGLASRGVLQDVDRAVVRVVSQHVAEGEGMDDANECLGGFVERTDRTASHGLDAVSDLGQRQSGEARGRRRSQFYEHAGIDAGSTVSGRTHESGQRLTETIRHFLRDVLDGRVDRGSEGQGGEVRVVGIKCV